jgi:hypothetical protein
MNWNRPRAEEVGAWALGWKPLSMAALAARTPKPTPVLSAALRSARVTWLATL